MINNSFGPLRWGWLNRFFIMKKFDKEISSLVAEMKAEIIKYLVRPETNGIFFCNCDFHTIVEGPCESEDKAACAYYVHDGKLYARYKPVMINGYECDYHTDNVKDTRVQLDYDKDDILLDGDMFHPRTALESLNSVKNYSNLNN